MSYLYFSGTNDPWTGTSVTDWHGPLMDAVAGHDWGNTDLFPSYGMPSL
jgi:hypothetical protein